jgi:signal transduction histidine kinase/CheY-like chemotaxis protein
VDPAQFRIVAKTEVWDAEVHLRQGTIDAAILEFDLTDVQPIRTIEQIRAVAPDLPIFIYTANAKWEWEEEAILLGVTHVLSKPIRGRILNALLARLFKTAEIAPPVVAPRAVEETRPQSSAIPPVRTLEVLRNFSSILTHSLCSGSLLKEFLMLLRGILGVNRAGIFLRRPPSTLPATGGTHDDRQLRAACAIGLTPSLMDHFELSLRAGIGGHLYRHGRLLKMASDEARVDREIQKEFELLGTQVAFPILDRESMVGVAVFDGRITGEPFTNEELSLVFHLLEELGLAIRNSWLHDQMLGNHQMMADVLAQLSCGCIVVGRDLAVLHANPAARRYFPAVDGRLRPVEFSDIPSVVGSKVFDAFNQGITPAPFRFRPAEQPGSVFQVSIAPFKRQKAATPNAALLLVEDFTQIERTQQLEIEASNLRLVRRMAESLAHEIGNAVVPISTYQQLLSERANDPEFISAFSSAMGEGVRRISRLAHQMLFLAGDAIDRRDSIPLHALITEAFRDAEGHLSETKAKLSYQSNRTNLTVLGNHLGVRHALSEVILNACQAKPAAPEVRILQRVETDANGTPWVRLELIDAGEGISPETARRASDPFFSKRNVGVGLGLTVTRKIIEAHSGQLEILPSREGAPGTVRISLPLENAASPSPKSEPVEVV